MDLSWKLWGWTQFDKGSINISLQIRIIHLVCFIFDESTAQFSSTLKLEMNIEFVLNTQFTFVVHALNESSPN